MLLNVGDEVEYISNPHTKFIVLAIKHDQLKLKKITPNLSFATYWADFDEIKHFDPLKVWIQLNGS